MEADPETVIAPSGKLIVNVAEGTTIEKNSVTLGQITINVSKADATTTPDIGDDETETTEPVVVCTVGGVEWTGQTIEVKNNTATTVAVTVDGEVANITHTQFIDGEGDVLDEPTGDTFTVNYSDHIGESMSQGWDFLLPLTFHLSP